MFVHSYNRSNAIFSSIDKLFRLINKLFSYFLTIMRPLIQHIAS